MKVLITGSSGLIGTALRKALSTRGDTVYRLLRTPSETVLFRWQPFENKIFFDNSVQIDVVIHLAGASLTDGPWDEQGKQRIRESRIIGTRLLSKQLATLISKPQLFISGSAIGFYGDTGDRIVTEQSPAGSGFLAAVCQQWERATASAEAAGIRTIQIRTGLVLSSAGRILAKMRRPFKFGLGGKIGDGNQYMSWVSIHDLIRMILFLMGQDSLTGPVNLVSPNPVTNYSFSKTLAQVLKSPSFLALPAWAARLIWGEMAEALLLSGSRVLPTRLVEAGYEFSYPELRSTLGALLNL